MTNIEAAERLAFAAKCLDRHVDACLERDGRMHSDESRTHEAMADALRLGAAALRDSEWLPIEGAPKDGTPIEIGFYRSTSKYEGLIFKGFWSESVFGGGFWTADKGDAHVPCRPTHYRPLPSPPKEQGNG